MTALVVVAMAEEAAPFLAMDDTPEALEVPAGSLWRLTVDGRPILLLRTGIGLVNAAVAVTHAIDHHSPGWLVSAGSAGGLGVDVRVGDVIVGSSYVYVDADASIFGYAPGQIPGMPATFEAAPGLVGLALAADNGGGTSRAGTIVSGNSFVDARSVDRVRSTFPDALAADMESTAIAHVAHLRGLPFVSVRAVSDLCGPSAGEDFSLAIDDVAARSAQVVRHVVAGLPA